MSCADIAISGSGGVTPPVTSTKTSSTSTPTSTSCAIASIVAVVFKEIATTSVGQTIKVAGSIPALGNWDAGAAPALSAAQYTSTNHLWTYTVNMPAGTKFTYKYINVQSSGTAKWESDPNRSFTVPTGCATTVTVSDTWR